MEKPEDAQTFEISKQKMFNLYKNYNFFIPMVSYYSKDHRILSKLMGTTKKKRKWCAITSTAEDSPTSVKALTQGSTQNRRVEVLNKLFMKHITDLLSTGNCAAEVVGLGIEVTKVKVSSDYTMINVYWTSNKIWDEERIKKSLVKAGMELRVELTSLRVVGNVPHIQFVRDRTYSAWTAVEDRLRTCDFGENYIPSGVNNFKLDFNNDILPPPQAQTQADKTDDEYGLPIMRHNVLGLDRQAILERIQSSMRNKSCLQEVREPKVKDGRVPFNQEVFSQFLLKRKVTRIKDHKSNEREDWALISLELLEERYDPSLSHRDDEDFIIEDNDDHA